MSSATSVTNASEGKLVDYVITATERLVFLAPGVSDRLAEALSETWRRLGRDAVSVVVDADPEVFRLGFGTIDGLKRLHATATEIGALVCHQSGLRIGLVICDNRTLIFSPTPL